MTAADYPWQSELKARLLAAAELPQSVLIAGPSGVGKAHLAGLLAKKHLCLQKAGAEQLMQCACQSCRLWQQGSHPDLRVTAPATAGGSLGIDQVREATGFIALSASVSSARMLIFQQADRMTNQAGNAVLKTLEEPPTGTCILLTAVQPGLLPPTVRSRVGEYPLHPPTRAQAIDWCRQQDNSLSAEDLSLLLQLVGGGPLDALALAQKSGHLQSLGEILSQTQALLSGAQLPLVAAEAWEKLECEEEALLLLRQLASAAALCAVNPDSAPAAQLRQGNENWRRCIDAAAAIPLRSLCDLEAGSRQALLQLKTKGRNKKWLMVGHLNEWQRLSGS